MCLPPLCSTTPPVSPLAPPPSLDLATREDVKNFCIPVRCKHWAAQWCKQSTKKSAEDWSEQIWNHGKHGIMNEAPRLLRVKQVLQVIDSSSQVAKVDTGKGVYCSGVTAKRDELGVLDYAGGYVEEEEWLGVLHKHELTSLARSFIVLGFDYWCVSFGRRLLRSQLVFGTSY